MSNGKPDLWEQSRRTMAVDTHTSKLARKAVLVSQDDDSGLHKQDAYISKVTLCSFVSGIAPVATAWVRDCSAFSSVSDKGGMMKHGSTKRAHMTTPKIETEKPINSIIAISLDEV